MSVILGPPLIWIEQSSHTQVTSIHIGTTLFCPSIREEKEVSRPPSTLKLQAVRARINAPIATAAGTLALFVSALLAACVVFTLILATAVAVVIATIGIFVISIVVLGISVAASLIQGVPLVRQERFVETAGGEAIRKVVISSSA